MHAGDRRALLLHLAILAGLFAAQFVLPAYHHTNFARIMVLACYAMGYNLLLGYVGLLSLGHAMLFVAGLYGAGLSAEYLGFGPLMAFLTGVAAGCALSLAVGLIALRTSGVAFMIVTLMFSQAVFLTTLYFSGVTGGDEGFVLQGAARRLSIGSVILDLSNRTARYNLALFLFAVCLIASFALVRSSTGRVFIAIRENEERAVMLGYDSFRYKLLATVFSGAMSAAAGAAYALLFAYVGSTFASIQYSILPLLWALLGGVGTTLGPLFGTAVMFYLIDFTSGYTSSYLLFVGVALVLIVMRFPQGILGTLRVKAAPWLP
jgi:branched-chain amino acid transport system permease protein